MAAVSIKKDRLALRSWMWTKGLGDGQLAVVGKNEPRRLAAAGRWLTRDGGHGSRWLHSSRGRSSQSTDTTNPCCWWLCRDQSLSALVAMPRTSSLSSTSPRSDSSLGRHWRKRKRNKGLSSYPVGQSSIISCRTSEGFRPPSAFIWKSVSWWWETQRRSFSCS